MKRMEVLDDWKQFILLNSGHLKTYNDLEVSAKLHPEKWSKKEVLGHLCDSAINNYVRIMNLLITKGNCDLQSYAQNQWVEFGSYQSRIWKDIIDEWVALNIGFISLVENAPETAWQYEGLYKDEKMSFEFLVTDYIVHMRHHFTQIFNNVI